MQKIGFVSTLKDYKILNDYSIIVAFWKSKESIASKYKKGSYSPTIG